MKFNSQNHSINIGFNNNEIIDNSNNHEFLELQDRVKSLNFDYYDYYEYNNNNNSNNNPNIENNHNGKLNNNNYHYDESPSTSYDKCKTNNSNDNKSNSYSNNSNNNIILNTSSGASGTGTTKRVHGHRRSKSCIASSSNKDYYYNIDLIFHKYSIRDGEETSESVISNHSLSDLKYINNRTKIFHHLINSNSSDLRELSVEKLHEMGFKDFSHQTIPYEEMNEIFKYIESSNELVRVLVALEFIFYHQNKHNHSHKCDYSNFIAHLFFDRSPVVFYCLTKLSNTYLSEKFSFKFIFQHEKIKDFFNDDLISLTERENRIKLFKNSGFNYHHGTLKRSKKKNQDFEKKLQKSFENQKEETNDDKQ
ncbi:hypothetical protein DICPUDRAFT_53277 [Dictyostelium purpureum]|uniref:Uncharacterized protein n=1 Tax=Dictyostelium purpureum TaxID=5786 RepID=F0ZC35_DICPU|nr:uncharacterized protein DICPUDRAFT_53277 [Dictyostelium purpureum]EGC38519.1 hypothetical protein DICPUDRAFT_53277 [Dictyostelium purpureum]|eukprot:XP_003284984.1 hypothetical protein DICPUDRAFT_53277 [Dictyostelium purpureum]